MRDPTAVIANTARQDIWNDIDRLRHWTVRMLFELDFEIHSAEALAHFLKEGDRKRLRKLMHDDPARFAKLISRDKNWAKLAHKRSRGRPKGQHAPGLAEALETKTFIQQKWREIFGRTYGHKDLAFEIAAMFYGFTAKQLMNYSKNK